MAVDTDAKRASALNFGGPITKVLPIPDIGAISSGERAHLLWLYSGIGAPIVFTGLLGVDARDRLGALDAQNRTGIHQNARKRLGNLTVRRH